MKQELKLRAVVAPTETVIVPANAAARRPHA